MRICSGGGTDGAQFFCGIGLAHENVSWSKSAIGHVRMGPYDTGDIVFLTNNSWDSSDCNMSHERMRITRSGNVGINNSSPNCNLSVNGIANIHNGSPYAVSNSRMQSGSLTIGGINANYGGGNGWSSNTAGLLLECFDYTEIAVHDANNRIVSLMYYGGGTYDNTIYIGRDMGWGTTPVQIQSFLYVSGNNSVSYNISAGPGNANVGYSGSGLFLWGGYNNSTVVVKDYSGTMAIGIYCFNGVSAKSFISISDIRIKKILNQLKMYQAL